jgi:tetratricopeptide (TPR) repeat protein
MLKVSLKLKTMLAIGVLLAVTISATAQRSGKVELKLGDPIPPLPTGEWFGEEPDLKGKQIKLLLFWEPAYSSSRLVFPILSKLQQRWGTDRLQIAGYGIEDLKSDDDEPYVRKWLIRQGPRIKFPVAVVPRRGLGRSWTRKLKSPFFFMVVVGPNNKLQAVFNPLSSELNAVVAQLISGRFDFNAMKKGQAYIEQLEKYRANRDWAQYKLTVERLRDINPRVFADQQIDYLVSLLTEQGQVDEGIAYINGCIESFAETDPDMLGMIAERLATDPSLPSDGRLLTLAEKAAKTSYDSAENAEAKARALVRMSEVHYKQGKTERAVEEAKKAYRIAPTNVKAEFKERWVDVKQRLNAGA